MSKLYIAGPMRGIPLFNFPAFNRATHILRALGYEVFNPAEADVKEGFKPDGSVQPQSLRYYMKRDLPAVLEVDAIILLPGWEQSQGAKLEEAVARAVGIPSYSLGDFLINVPIPAPLDSSVTLSVSK